MSRVGCETAAQCQQIAQLQKAWLVDLVVWTVIGAVALLVLLHLFQGHRKEAAR